MLTIKRIGAWMLVLCMLLAQVVPVHAAEEYTNATLIVSDATAEAGTQVKITIEMVNNPGIVSMALDVDYDNTILSLVGTDLDDDWCPDGVIDGDILGSWEHSDNATLDPYRLSWSNDSSRRNFTEDGVLVTLVFDVAETAAAGEYPVVLSYNPIDIYNRDVVSVHFDTVDGVITITPKVCKHTDKTEVPAKSPDCDDAGNHQYFVCDDCGVAFKADGVTETTVEVETIEALGHDWSEASCDVAKTCGRCGETEGSELGHSFTNYVSNNDADCENDGTKTAKCDRCDETDTIEDEGSALGHNWSDATCDVAKTCDRCGETEGSALGHSFTNYVSDENATCEEDGTKTAKCDRCDETDTVKDEGSALGHAWSTEWTKDEGGHWIKCGNCIEEKNYGDHTYGDAGDICETCGYERDHVHRLTQQKANAATCTDAGNKAYYTCSGCDTWFEDASGLVEIENKDSVVIPALDHSFTNYVSNNDADCENDGTKTAKCDRCDETDTVEDEGSVLGHDWEDATCNTVKTCKRCGTTEGDVLGHSFTNYVSDENATCEEDGTKTAKCDRCDETDTVADEGSALGHAWSSEWSKNENVHWLECDNCDDVKDTADHDYGGAGDICGVCGYERNHVHRLTQKEANDPTCTEDGNKAHYVCGGCDALFEDASGLIEIENKNSVVIPALDHSFTNYVSNNDADCENDGTMTAKCDRCDETDTIADEGSVLGHSFTNYVSDENATCEEDGTKTAKCDRCDETDTVVDEGSASGHDWSDATCEDAKTCGNCGATVGEPLGHSFTNYVSDENATCEEDGTKTAKCDRCDETDTIVDEGSAIGHDWASEWSKGEEGHWHECANCGDKKDLADHDFGDAGDVCGICGYERDHVHRLTLHEGFDATCTEDGQKDYYTCSGCEDWFFDAAGSIAVEDKGSVVIPALDHDWNDATCTEPKTCDRCGETEGDALDHDWIEATCEEPKTCRRCGETEGEALGHDYQDGVCANCGGKDPSTEKPDKPNKPIIPNWSSIIKNWLDKWWGHDEPCDHDYESVVTDPTCTEKGYTTHTCSKCGDSYKDTYVNATGHDYENNVCVDCGHKKVQKPIFGFWFDWFWKK